MTNDTRERARQVARDVGWHLLNMTGNNFSQKLNEAERQITDAMVAFANAAASAENEVCERLVLDAADWGPVFIADAIAARRKERK